MQTARTQNLPSSIILDMYQSMVVPILLYGSEIWGYENCNIGLLEKLQIKFLKHLFRLSKSTMTNMIYGETGIYPLRVLIKMRMIRFWSTLISCNTHKYSSKLYSVLHNLYISNLYSSKWIQSIKDILIETGFDCVWESQSFLNRENLCKNVSHILKDQFHQEWKQALNQSNKCLYYVNFKTSFCRENYISQLPDVYVINLFKFRCSNHKLPIEIGRYSGMPRQNRICKECNLDVLGDEFHFIMECPKYKQLRDDYLPKSYMSPRSVYNFCKLFSSNKNVQLRLSKFIKFANVV